MTAASPSGPRTSLTHPSPFGALIEICSAAIVGLGVGLAEKQWYLWLAAGLVFLSAAAVLRARGDAAVELATERRLRAQADSKHVVTAARLATLEQAGLEDDVLRVLSAKAEGAPISGDALVAYLEGELGRRRTGERRELVLRYTEV